MIIRTSIDNQLPGWAVSAGKALIILMVIGLALVILRDLEDMRRGWGEYTVQWSARGTNVPPILEIPQMPRHARTRLIRHEGVDLEEITLERKDDDRTAGVRLDDDDKRL